MKYPHIPKSHPLLTYWGNVMLTDIRQYLARELRRMRRIERLKKGHKQ